MKPIDIVHRYFRAMAAGREAADELFALFDDDAVYIEPFSGAAKTHQGRSAIETYLSASWDNAPPDLQLAVDRVDVDGEVVVSDWTCTSPAFPGPIRGQDRCWIVGGRIQRLEVALVGVPQ